MLIERQIELSRRDPAGAKKALRLLDSVVVTTSFSEGREGNVGLDILGGDLKTDGREG